MNSLFRLFHTLRYLKFKQVVYRFYYRFKKLKAYNSFNPELRGNLKGFYSPAFDLKSTVDGKSFTFLGVTAKLNGDWNSPQFPKLWLYNLHYQDDLNAIGADERFPLCQQLLDDWIVANPPRLGNGWEPYCLSLRLVNWVKWLSRVKPEDIKPEWIESLAIQVDALDQQIEYHILANHLFANAKALVFAGAFFGGKQGDHWLQRGLKILDQELVEQFLDDGAHFELSPMYHAILLWDLADLIYLQQITKIPSFHQRVLDWEKKFILGLEWLQALVHPDNELSFFNDATLGISPTLANLINYAEFLGLLVPVAKFINQPQGRLLGSSGYVVIDWPLNHRLIADLAFIGPDYQPGHAHADTLSCELSLFGQRVLVNSGISQYGEDAERQRQRSTAAHNTVVVDGENSSEVWAGFRVARRAKPFGVELQHLDNRVVLSASHDGYSRLFQNVIHKRQWIAETTSLIVTDEILGRYSEAIAHWHFHPDIKLVQQHEACFELTLPQGQVVSLKIFGADVEICESTWHPGFGKSFRNLKLMLKLKNQILKTQIEWTSD